MIDGLRQGRPAFLASVMNAGEAEVALAGGADIIDCKNPASGALGALSTDTVHKIVQRIGRRLPVSATVGDLPAHPEILTKAAAKMAATGVDIIKIGFFGDSDPRRGIEALGAARAAPIRLVAVLMADRDPDLTLLAELAAAGFEGAMLDTADKSSGGLTSALPFNRLADFVQAARGHGLLAGLAGSLKESDIAVLVDLDPDVMGFRGALCGAGRESALEPDRVASVRQKLDAAKLVRAGETSAA